MCLLDDGRFAAILTALSLLKSQLRVLGSPGEKWQLQSPTATKCPSRTQVPKAAPMSRMQMGTAGRDLTEW